MSNVLVLAEVAEGKLKKTTHSAITFESGTLAIDHDLSNVGDTKDRTDFIVQVIEKNL